LGLLPALTGDAETEDMEGPIGRRAEPLLPPVDRERARKRPLAARLRSTTRLPREDLRHQFIGTAKFQPGG
jgi:hypothetical protein